MSVARALVDPDLFAPWLGDPKPWGAWLAILKGAMAEPMTATEIATFRRLTGREPPAEAVRELWVVSGRRSGKSTMAAALAVHWAAVMDHRGELRAGEVATIPVIAQDRAAARTVFRYARALLEAAGLDGLVVRDTSEALELSTGATIEITTAAGRAVRGYSMPLIVADEIAHWRSDSSLEPDVEIIEALRPSQVTFRQPLLVAISSPWSRRGALWTTFKERYAKPGDVLVVQGASFDFNATIPRSEIDRAVARDPARAQAEWHGEFRADIATYVSCEVAESLVAERVHERAPEPGTKYESFVDPSGGAGTDCMSLAIAHRRGDVAVLDLLDEVHPPFSPEAVVERFTQVLKRYGCSEVTGDKFGGSWPAEQFQKRGIRYRPSERTRAEIYLEVLPAMMSGKVELLDNGRLLSQLCGLERRMTRSGRELIDHGPHGHDDLVNSAAGALLAARGQVGLPEDFNVADNSLVGRPLVVKEYGVAGPWPDMEAFSRDYHL